MQTIRVAGPLAANSSDILAEAAASGMGVTLLASWAVQDDLRSGKLVKLLPQWRIDSDLEPWNISFVWDRARAHGVLRARWGRAGGDQR